MARKVFISSAMSADEVLLEMGEENEQTVMMWPWLLTLFDDWGRAEVAPRSIKAMVFSGMPSITPHVILSAIEALGAKGIVEVYEANGKRFFAVPYTKWLKYQTHIRNEKRVKDESKFPPQPSYKPSPADAKDTKSNNSSEQVNAPSRGNAHLRAVADVCIPSPSPSPSLSPSPSPSLSKETTTTESGVVSEEDVVAASLASLGVSEDVVQELIRDPNTSVEEIQRQIDWLPARKPGSNPAALLVKAIRGHWPMPHLAKEAEAKREAKSQQREKRVQEDVDRQKTDEEREAQEAERKLVDALFRSLPKDEQAAIEAITRQLFSEQYPAHIERMGRGTLAGGTKRLYLGIRDSVIQQRHKEQAA